MLRPVFLSTLLLSGALLGTLGILVAVGPVAPSCEAQEQEPTPAPAPPEEVVPDPVEPAPAHSIESDLELLYELLWLQPGEEPFDLTRV